MDADSRSLRQRQQQQTRDSILDAYLHLAHERNAVNVSVPAVAEAAGVSVRTVYRYFATKDELQHAAAYRMSEQALHGADVTETTADNLQDNLKMLWSVFADRLPAVIAEHSTPAGREIRRARLPGARESVARALPDNADAEAVDLIVAVTSSSMFLELADRMNHPPEVAAAMATRLAELVLTDSLTRSETGKQTS